MKEIYIPPIDIRPKCIECGGNVRSSGNQWNCTLCNRKFRKKFRDRPRNIKDTSCVPPCPRCGASDFVFNGNLRVRCRQCMKTYNSGENK